MKLPIRNHSASPLTLVIEPLYESHEIPPGGEAIVTLQDGQPHSVDVHDGLWVTVWNDGNLPTEVVVFATHDSLRSGGQR